MKKLVSFVFTLFMALLAVTSTGCGTSHASTRNPLETLKAAGNVVGARLKEVSTLIPAPMPQQEQGGPPGLSNEAIRSMLLRWLPQQRCPTTWFGSITSADNGAPTDIQISVRERGDVASIVGWPVRVEILAQCRLNRVFLGQNVPPGNHNIHVLEQISFEALGFGEYRIRFNGTLLYYR